MPNYSNNSQTMTVKKTARKKKVSEDEIPIDELKKGSLKRQLKIKKDDPPLKIRELQKLKKLENGETTEFRGKMIKMTPLMKKRVNLGITLMRLPKN